MPATEVIETREATVGEGLAPSREIETPENQEIDNPQTASQITPETTPAEASEETLNQELPPSDSPGGEQALEQSQKHVTHSQAPFFLEDLVFADELSRVMEVTIIKPGPAQVYIRDLQATYGEESLKNSLPMWEGAACFCDHFNKSVRNIAGVYFSPWYEEDTGVKARLRFTDCSLYYMIRQVMQDRKNGLPVPDIGISADFIVTGVERNNSFDVTEINQVISADIVFAPAAGGSFDRVLNSAMQQLGITEGESVPPAPERLENTEKRIRDLQGTADRLRNQVTEQETQIEQLLSERNEAVTRYRAGILRDNPEIPGHLLTGSTIEELDASLEEAQTVVNSVRQHLEEQVPPGAPARTGVDVSSLSPRQKIEYGVTHGRARR